MPSLWWLFHVEKAEKQNLAQETTAALPTTITTTTITTTETTIITPTLPITTTSTSSLPHASTAAQIPIPRTTPTTLMLAPKIITTTAENKFERIEKQGVFVAIFYVTLQIVFISCVGSPGSKLVVSNGFFVALNVSTTILVSIVFFSIFFV